MTEFDTDWMTLSALELNSVKEETTNVYFRKANLSFFQPVSLAMINNYQKHMQSAEKSYKDVQALFPGACVVTVIAGDETKSLWVRETEDQIRRLMGIQCQPLL